MLSRQFRTSTPENDTNTVSKPNGNTKQFSHPLFCWAVATIVETSNHVDGEIFQGYLQQHNAIPRLYDFWLANKEQELQSVYSAALERCCGTRYAFDELVKVNFDGMIEAGLRCVGLPVMTRTHVNVCVCVGCVLPLFFASQKYLGEPCSEYRINRK